MVQNQPASTADTPASMSVTNLPDRRYDWAYQRVASMPKPAQSGWPAEYQIAGVSMTDVVPTKAIAASPIDGRAGFARHHSRRSGTSPRSRSNTTRPQAPSAAAPGCPRLVTRAKVISAPRGHDVRVVRLEQVCDRLLPVARGRNVSDIVAEEKVHARAGSRATCGRRGQ